ncbi:MAG: hypothetical protein JWL77_4005 [Chthonomonadaceae bacterium]|nr:hypothetical protein [Chthonomonadaceae bacterium]
MPRRKLNYKEGDWIAVPLKDGGYALGIAARVSRGGAIFGYFFGPRYPDVPTASNTTGLLPSKAVFIGMFGDLGLLEGIWMVIRSSEPWRREEWPMPDFGRVDPMDSTYAVRTTYNEDRITEAIDERRVSPEEARSLPEDGLFGDVALELYLNRLLPIGITPSL